MDKFNWLQEISQLQFVTWNEHEDIDRLNKITKKFVFNNGACAAYFLPIPHIQVKYRPQNREENDKIG